MDTNHSQHDENADTGGSSRSANVPVSRRPRRRPDDPAVIAAAAGKTTPERSTKNERQHQPSQQHNRGPPPDDDDDEPVAGGDLLVSKDAIRDFLASLGMPPNTDPYYLKRSGWPIGNTGGDGGKLIASKRRLARHAEKLARGSTAA